MEAPCGSYFVSSCCLKDNGLLKGNILHYRSSYNRTVVCVDRCFRRGGESTRISFLVVPHVDCCATSWDVVFSSTFRFPLLLDSTLFMGVRLLLMQRDSDLSVGGRLLSFRLDSTLFYGRAVFF